MSESIVIELEPCTDAEIAFFDSFKSLDDIHTAERRRLQSMQEQIRDGSLLGVLQFEGYTDQAQRMAIYKYMTAYKWDEPLPARCMCKPQYICWACRLNALRDWADSVQINDAHGAKSSAIRKLRMDKPGLYNPDHDNRTPSQKWEERMGVPKYNILGVMLTAREISELIGIEKKNVNTYISRWGQVEGIARIIKKYGGNSEAIKLLQAQRA